MRKLTFAVFALVVCVAAPAATMTQYTYSGDTYTASACAGSYCTGGPYALTVTFDTSLTGAALDNLPYNTDITSDITSFSISDGSGFGLTQTTASSYNFQIGTDGSGNLDWWQINVAVSPPPYFEPGSSAAEATFLAYYYPNYPQILDRTAWTDGSVQGECFNYGSVVTSGCLGNWTMQTIGGTTGAPEPSSGVLVGAGFLSLLGFLVRRKVASPAR
jgi:hypothetical protein